MPLLFSQLTMTMSFNFNVFWFSFFTQASRRVDDLFEDLRDGHNLLSLLEVLSGEHLVSVSADFNDLQSKFDLFLV